MYELQLEQRNKCTNYNKNNGTSLFYAAVVVSLQPQNLPMTFVVLINFFLDPVLTIHLFVCAAVSVVVVVVIEGSHLVL